MSTNEFNELYKFLYELSIKNTQSKPELEPEPEPELEPELEPEPEIKEDISIIVKYNPIPPKQRKKICKNIQCQACLKSFVLQKSLNKHHEQNELCKTWIPSNPPIILSIYNMVFNLLDKSITGDNPYQCKFCKHIFTNKIIHYQHYQNTPVCNSMAYNEFKKLQ